MSLTLSGFYVNKWTKQTLKLKDYLNKPTAPDHNCTSCTYDRPSGALQILELVKISTQYVLHHYQTCNTSWFSPKFKHTKPVVLEELTIRKLNQNVGMRWLIFLCEREPVRGEIAIYSAKTCVHWRWRRWYPLRTRPHAIDQYLLFLNRLSNCVTGFDGSASKYSHQLLYIYI